MSFLGIIFFIIMIIVLMKVNPVVGGAFALFLFGGLIFKYLPTIAEILAIPFLILICLKAFHTMH